MLSSASLLIHNSEAAECHFVCHKPRTYFSNISKNTARKGVDYGGLSASGVNSFSAPCPCVCLRVKVSKRIEFETCKRNNRTSEFIRIIKRGFRRPIPVRSTCCATNKRKYYYMYTKMAAAGWWLVVLQQRNHRHHVERGDGKSGPT